MYFYDIKFIRNTFSRSPSTKEHHASTPNSEVTRAWETHQRLNDLAYKTFPYVQAGMRYASDLCQNAKRERELNAAMALFLESVIRYHGAQTVVEIKGEDFALYNLSPVIPANQVILLKHE